MACSPGTHTIAVGTELAGHASSIYLWDVRTATARAQYHEVHSDDVTALRFHPRDAALLLSGSTDGLVNLYDTRVADEDDVTLQTLNHNASIHDAGFLSPTDVFALSHDERFALYDVADDDGARSGDAAQDFGDLRDTLGGGTQYVAAVTPKTDGTGAVIGAGSQECVVFVFPLVVRGASTDPRMQQANV